MLCSVIITRNDTAHPSEISFYSVIITNDDTANTSKISFYSVIITFDETVNQSLNLANVCQVVF